MPNYCVRLDLADRIFVIVVIRTHFGDCCSKERPSFGERLRCVRPYGPGATKHLVIANGRAIGTPCLLCYPQVAIGGFAFAGEDLIGEALVVS
jgi:hypothetical protein